LTQIHVAVSPRTRNYCNHITPCSSGIKIKFTFEMIDQSLVSLKQEEEEEEEVVEGGGRSFGFKSRHRRTGTGTVREFEKWFRTENAGARSRKVRARSDTEGI